jgi:hypothetical protein
MSEPNPLWDVIQAYMDDPKHRYPPKPADLARETGVSDQVLSKWKARPTLPSPDQLIRVARGTGIPYADLLMAAVRGKGYVPPSTRKEVEAAIGSAARDDREWVDAWMRAELEVDFVDHSNWMYVNQLAVIISDLLDGGEGIETLFPTKDETWDAWKRAKRLRLQRAEARRAVQPPTKSFEDSPVDVEWMRRSLRKFWNEEAGMVEVSPDVPTKADVDLAADDDNPLDPVDEGIETETST